MLIRALLGVSQEEERARNDKIFEHQSKVRREYSFLLKRSDFHIKKVREIIARDLSILFGKSGVEHNNTDFVEKLVVLKRTKKALCEIISWSSSRYNSWKKQEVIEDILAMLAQPAYPSYSGKHFESGVFSAGALGHGGGKFGGRNFHAKNSRGGSYQLFFLDAMPFLVVDNAEIFLFEGFNYSFFTVDSEFLGHVAAFERALTTFDF